MASNLEVGALGLGIAPDVKLTIKDATDASSESGVRIIRSANADCGWINVRGGAFTINTRNNAANAGIPFLVKGHGTDWFKIDAAGLATFSNGLAFTQTGTAATGAATTSSTLDHYEEGTWTPVFTGATVNTGAANTGTFVRIGNLCQCTLEVVQTALSGTAGAQMDGLPFAALTGTNANNAIAFSVQDCGHTTNTVTTDNGRFRVNGTYLAGVKTLGSTTYMTYDQLWDGSGDLNMSGSFTYRIA
tara:strand:+ start:473 stop:1210 length:738 start_codon:yes stop_codon:yes gene_type:complete